MTIKTWEELKVLTNNQWPDEGYMKAEIDELRAELAALKAQPVQTTAIDRYVWEKYDRWATGWGWEECEFDDDPRKLEYKKYYTKEDWADPEQIRNFRALYAAPVHPVPAVTLTDERITKAAKSLGIGSYQTLAAAFKAGVQFAEFALKGETK